MAQLNPNFEIDFSDINSYEQIQLINDTQLAKENLLMHRAYKEPSDDEIIRNQFSSFTFVDFCPKLYSIKPPSLTTRGHLKQIASDGGGGNKTTGSDFMQSPGCASSSSRASSSQITKCYELESFSDLFERINTWLKLNKDWRVVSMETLIYDCTTQFNHQKSSIYSKYLPQNTRGLRLFLSPSKSRFSGPQKIGCINVVPRKVSGSYLRPDEPPVYETLDEILNRLNELLLTRPIEGRILSVETLTLPMVNGYVNTESNYFIDNRLNSLYERTYTFASTTSERSTTSGSGAQMQQQSSSLIDILRVYYEFGPIVCGLVNLIDFLPRFYCPKQTMLDKEIQAHNNNDPHRASPGVENLSQAAPMPKPVPKIAATETLTRLVRRSLAWFELERKRTLEERRLISSKNHLHHHHQDVSWYDLKACNVQVHHKILLKGHLLQANSINVHKIANTRSMVHEHMIDKQPPIECSQCSILSSDCPLQEWCQHLIELTQPYSLKFVRLAYVIPLSTRHGRSIRAARPLRLHRQQQQQPPPRRAAEAETFEVGSSGGRHHIGQLIPDLSSTSSGSTSSSASPSASSTPESASTPEPGANNTPPNHGQECDLSDHRKQNQVNFYANKLLQEGQEEEEEEQEKGEEEEQDAKHVALSILRGTNERHMSDELANQLRENDDGLNDSPIGQLTYRLFAPCQLVNSSSCFSINPVNSSSPLARRGSVNINGSGISSENANPSTYLLSQGSCNSIPGAESQQQQLQQQQVVTSFGAFSPSISHDFISASSASHEGGGGLPGSKLVGSLASSVANSSSGGGGNGSRFTTNEFESVDAIKRRMEVYVTTSSMKVIAGSTLIVHLSDARSCLSTAIEQTVVRAAIYPSQRPPIKNTWISVYVLYAAVEEPQLPAQLLAQQRMRELSLIDENDRVGGGMREDQEEGEEEEEKVEEANVNSLFDDGFPATEFSGGSKRGSTTNTTTGAATVAKDSQVPLLSNSIRVKQNPLNSSLTLYNSAYDRTVALPTQPENHSGNSVDPADYLGSDGVWIDEDPLSDKVVHMPDMEARKKRRKRAKRQKRAAGGRRLEDSQCSIM